MFACILNINPLKSSVGFTSPVVVFLIPGDGDISKKCFKNIVTPKSARAEPKNTGESFPSSIASLSNSLPAPSTSSISLLNISRLASLITPSSSGPNTPLSPSSIILSLLYKSTQLSRRLYTPSKSCPLPIGHVTATEGNPSASSKSSRSSSGSFACLSSLLINVNIGIWRILQTLKSFFVWVSTPFAASITITALSTDVSIRYVSSPKSL